MLLFTTLVNHRLWWHSTKFHYQFNLFLFIVSWKKWLTCIKLRKDASERPNIDFLSVFDPKNHLWRTIKARLNISIDLIISEAAWSKVNNFKIAASCVRAQNVLRLEITVNNLMLFKEHQSFDDLNGIISNLICREADEPCCLKMLKKISV